MKKITKKELSDLYFSNTNEQTCKILGISNPTLSKYLKTSGIKRKGVGWRGKKRRNKILITE